MYTRVMGLCEDVAKAMRSSCRAGFLLGLFAAFVVTTGPSGAASRLDPFSSLVERQKSRDDNGRSVVQQFTAAPDSRRFAMQTGRHGARIQFLCREGDQRLACAIAPERTATEIIPLTSERGVRGDVLYRDPGGRLLVRMTPYGNATVYWPGETFGRAATKRSEAPGQLRRTSFTPEETRSTLERASETLSERFGLSLDFDVSRTALTAASSRADLGADLPAVAAYETSPNDAMIADALLRAADGIGLALRDSEEIERAVAENLAVIRIVEGDAPSVDRDGDELTITIVPSLELAGRPSEDQISGFILRSF
ncbi:MAG: DUF4908 domain-containing protein [Alphaproteobacteria bacterium]|nr:DUF4908 domain-containing protein [Alphaproteobacteria bacterium]